MAVNNHWTGLVVTKGSTYSCSAEPRELQQLNLKGSLMANLDIWASMVAMVPILWNEIKVYSLRKTSHLS